MKVVVLGGGIIGLSSAYYLKESGHEVVLIDKTDISSNCSYGNAGYVNPYYVNPYGPNYVPTNPNIFPGQQNANQLYQNLQHP